jgi:hypothetical protein
MNQEYKEIEKLIERFFDGQTSAGEEQRLYAFFSNDNIPEHLLPYRPVFSYFETGIKEEPKHREFVPKTIQSSRKKMIRIWTSVAASLLILISFGIHYFIQNKEYNPYEGSYIIRNGVKITDPKIVNPEIEKTLYLVQLQEEEYKRLLQQMQEANINPYDQKINEIKQKHLKWIEQIENESIRKEALKIINFDI